MHLATQSAAAHITARNSTSMKPAQYVWKLHVSYNTELIIMLLSVYCNRIENMESLTTVSVLDV
jgi:hypothetical protein